MFSFNSWLDLVSSAWKGVIQITFFRLFQSSVNTKKTINLQMSFLFGKRKNSIPVGKPPTAPLNQGKVKTAEEAKREAMKQPVEEPPPKEGEDEKGRRMSQSRRISQTQFGKPLSELPPSMQKKPSQAKN